MHKKTNSHVGDWVHQFQIWACLEAIVASKSVKRVYTTEGRGNIQNPKQKAWLNIQMLRQMLSFPSLSAATLLSPDLVSLFSWTKVPALIMILSPIC